MSTFTLKPPVREGEYRIKEGWGLRRKTDTRIDLESEPAISLHGMNEGLWGEYLVYVVVSFEIDDDDNIISCYATLMKGDITEPLAEIDVDKMFHECFEEAECLTPTA